MGIAIVGAHAVIALVITAAQCQRVLHGSACAAGFIEPIDVTTQVNSSITPAKTDVAVFLCVHHLQFLVDEVPGILS